ncbi:MAG: hypothetical protein M1376_05855 [Planctomycetes bacterium]|nr:hypothetical protein [Planctomycetota bacterium]
MGTRFNVFEVLQIAEEVERKAAAFYLEAAQRFADRERRNLCHRLAASRTRHQQAWVRLRREYSEHTRELAASDPDNYILSHPEVMAGLTCFATHPAPHNRPMGHETKDQILRDAVQRSRDLTIFYHGLKEFAGGPDSRKMIDNLILEEDLRIRLLSGSVPPC